MGQLFQGPAKEVNPNKWEVLLAAYLAEQEKAKDPKAYELRRLSAKWQAEQAEKEREAKLAADPHRTEIAKKVSAMETAIRWDERATAAEVYEVGQLARSARRRLECGARSGGRSEGELHGAAGRPCRAEPRRVPTATRISERGGRDVLVAAS